MSAIETWNHVLSVRRHQQSLTPCIVLGGKDIVVISDNFGYIKYLQHSHIIGYHSFGHTRRKLSSESLSRLPYGKLRDGSILLVEISSAAFN